MLDGLRDRCPAVHADLSQVLAHGSARRFRVLPSDSFQNPFVVILPAYRAVSKENAFALFPQEVHDGIDQNPDK